MFMQRVYRCSSTLKGKVNVGLRILGTSQYFAGRKIFYSPLRAKGLQNSVVRRRAGF